VSAKQRSVFYPLEFIRDRFISEYRTKFPDGPTLKWHGLAILALTPAAAAKVAGCPDFLAKSFADHPDATCHFLKWIRKRSQKSNYEAKVLNWIAYPRNAYELRRKLRKPQTYHLTQKEIATEIGCTRKQVENALRLFPKNARRL
jgi:hypothetical protein